MSEQKPDRSRRSPVRSFFRYIALVLVVLILSIGLMIGTRIASQPSIRISPETTHFTQPLTESGQVDFAEAINQHFEADIRPEENVAVLLYEALGPRPDGVQLSDEFFGRLGVNVPPEEGRYFLKLHDWLKQSPTVSLDAVERTELLLEFRDSQGVPWLAETRPEVVAWLRDMESPLQRTREAVQREKYFSPLICQTNPDGSRGLLVTTLLPGAHSSTGIARALIARATLRISEGRHDDALQDLITCHRLGRFIGRGPTLIEKLIGLSIEAEVIDAEQVWLEVAEPNDPQLLRLSVALDELPERGSVAESIDVTERGQFLDLVSGLSAGDDSMNDLMMPGTSGDRHGLLKLMQQLVDWNVAMEIGNEWYDRLAEMMRIADRETRAQAESALRQDLEIVVQHPRKWEDWTRTVIPGSGESVSRNAAFFVIGLMVPASATARDAKDRIIQRLRNLRIAIALCEYRNIHHTWPKQLSDLRSGTSNPETLDLYSQGPVLYRRTEYGYLLYSVGYNGKNDGGDDGHTNGSSADDIAVRVPFERPGIED